MKRNSELEDRYGVEVNSISMQKLLQKYEEAGFLYKEKKELLEPLLKTIVQHWEKMMCSREELLWVQTNKNWSLSPNFATVTLWKHSNRGLFSQHLVSNGRNPALSLRTMMAAQYKTQNHFSACQMSSSQNWFRPENRYADRILGSMVNSLGPDLAARIVHNYLHLHLEKIEPAPADPNLVAQEISEGTVSLTDFITAQHNKVFVVAEELDQDDLTFQGIGDLYLQYGLIKFRKIFCVTDRLKNKILGCAVANRAPIGINFSFLENRCYYILDQSLPIEKRLPVIKTLNRVVGGVYQDFALKAIPVVTDFETATAMERIGAKAIRQYAQSIWLREGFDQWHDHIGSFLRKIERRYPAE